jgi:hypothetical protein
MPVLSDEVFFLREESNGTCGHSTRPIYRYLLTHPFSSLVGPVRLGPLVDYRDSADRLPDQLRVQFYLDSKTDVYLNVREQDFRLTIGSIK